MTVQCPSIREPHQQMLSPRSYLRHRVACQIGQGQSGDSQFKCGDLPPGKRIVQLLCGLIDAVTLRHLRSTSQSQAAWRWTEAGPLQRFGKRAARDALAVGSLDVQLA